MKIKKIEKFIKNQGRRPRVLVSCAGKIAKGDRAGLIASCLSDTGFDVDMDFGVKSPEDLVRLGLENNVHGIMLVDYDKDFSLKNFNKLLKKQSCGEIYLIKEVPLKNTYDSILNEIEKNTEKWLGIFENNAIGTNDVSYYIKGIYDKDRKIIAKTITLLESSLKKDQEKAKAIVDELLPKTGKAMRIGISGVPGVGKSTFIESFGIRLIKKDHRIGVVAIDPTSSRTGGSLMGDKTRMQRLCRQSHAFIRPSPAGEVLGGVAGKTREAMVILEAAGFDIIIVETVGVGQSETAAASMVDFFLVLMLAGAGDEIQGMKKGILELADAIAINKADGDNIAKANKAKQDYEAALHLICSASVWHPPVLTCSALTNEGIDKVWDTISEHRKKLEAAGELGRKRKQQLIDWMWDIVNQGINEKFYQNRNVQKMLPEISALVKEGKAEPTWAAGELLKAYIKR